ncbi:MAG: response regulator transcription factor [Polyangiaceae bacterium]|nr:response regulator transcription factor [Polyangiaceae bacterium]
MKQEESATARLLIIEDDESISLGLKMNLEAEGYVVRTADDGQTGLELALSEEFDLLILDIMLPKENGLEVLRRLRAAEKTVPVIMLSARSSEQDKVLGLELGAEDYITKPFSLAELLARIKAVLRRDRIARSQPKKKISLVRAGSLSIDARSREVHRDGVFIELTATVLDVLWCLVEAQGEVLARGDIQTKVWGPDHYGTLRTIDNFLLQLRAKLEVDTGSPEHLLTVRGVGYRFAGGEELEVSD